MHQFNFIIFKKLEEIIASLEQEKYSSVVKTENNPNSKLRKSLLLAESHDITRFNPNKSISVFFNTLDEGKISNFVNETI